MINECDVKSVGKQEHRRSEEPVAMMEERESLDEPAYLYEFGSEMAVVYTDARKACMLHEQVNPCLTSSGQH